jgi:hypothetical protein
VGGPAYQILDLSESLDHPQQATFHGLRDALELHDVSFRYGHRAHVLGWPSVFNWQDRGNYRRKGSGKSTLLKLLMGSTRPPMDVFCWMGWTCETGARVMANRIDWCPKSRSSSTALCEIFGSTGSNVGGGPRRLGWRDSKVHCESAESDMRRHQ